MMNTAIIPPSAVFGYPQLSLTADKLKALTKSLMDLGWDYGLGSKIEPISQQAPNIYAIDEQGNRVHAVDCSGFVRWALFHATGGLAIPDGSATQHEWFTQQNFKRSDYTSALDHDNVVRIGFLAPEDTAERIGHVLLCLNGETMESHGSVGPDTRDLAEDPGMGFAKAMHWFVVKML